MMIQSLTAGELIATCYRDFFFGQEWEASKYAGTTDANESPRLYCPDCHQHGTVTLKFPDDLKKPWHCSRCKGRFKNPSTLRGKGTINAKNSRGGSNDTKFIIDIFLANRVRAAVEALPPVVKTWALWVYTEETKGQLFILEQVIKELDEAKESLRNITDGYRLIRFALLVIDNTRHKLRTGQTLHSTTQLATLIGMGHSEFAPGRRWSRLRERIELSLSTMDERASTAVLILINRAA